MLDLNALISQKEHNVDFSHSVNACELVPEAEDGTLSVVGVVTRLAGYIELKADFTLKARVLCARCATPFDTEYSFSVVMPVAPSLENEEDEADYVLAPDGMLDLDDFCRTAAVLNLPVRYLCREDCRGLCPHCGTDLNSGSCSCGEVKVDPRLAKLSELLK